MKKRNFLLLILCVCILSANTIGNYAGDYEIIPQEHLGNIPIKR